MMVGFFANNKNKDFIQAQEAIEHTNSVIARTLLISQKLSQLVSGQRVYLLSGNNESLIQYNDTKKTVSILIKQLSEKINDNEAQIVRVQHLDDLYFRLIEQLDNRLNNPTSNIFDTQNVRDIEASILNTANAILNEEYADLRLRMDYMKDIQSKLLIGIFAGFIFNGLILLFLNYYLFNSKRQSLINEDRLQYALSASGEGIYDWNIKTNAVFYSIGFVEMLGYHNDEFGVDLKAFKNRVFPEDIPQVEETIAEFINNKLSEYSVEFRMVHKMGHVVWINARAEIVRDKKGNALKMIGTHRDISDQKNIEQNLVEVIENVEKESDAKSSFLAHMSHEIRTPLTAITGIAEILQKNSNDFNARQKKLISTLMTSTQSLKDLVTDILDFSKIEKGEIEFDNQYFPLIELIGEVISIMSVPANEKNIKFKVIDDSIKDIKYFGDKKRIRQILINLIGNAIKFTDEGTVSLLVKKEIINDTDVLNFYVQDTGIGIDGTMINSIFEEFRQGDSSVSRKYGGTGLGLPISKNLSQLMGGDITVDSTQGLGSCFTLSLPMQDRTQIHNTDIDPALKQKITDRLSATIRDEQTALIVEDYEGNIVILSYLMEEIGLPFDVAKNGQQAIDMWRERHYDIVLMDVQMPVKDGLTATAEIRQIEEENGFNPTPIIGMTAHALVQDKNKCISAGMTDYLSKPIDSNQLKQKILNHIQKDNVVRIKKSSN